MEILSWYLINFNFSLIKYFECLILKLLPGYRGLVVDSLPNLFSLDDKPISKEERINYLDFKMYEGKKKT